MRVQLNDGREEWIDLDNHFQLEMLELSDGSLSLSEMIEEVLEEELSEGDSQGIGDLDGGIDAQEERERRAVDNVTDGVLTTLRSLYSKGLIGFRVK